MGKQHKIRRPARRRVVPFNTIKLVKEICPKMTTSNDNGEQMPLPSEIALPSKWMKLEERIELLERRVAQLENAPKPSTDDISTQIYEFLKSMPGVKFNTGSIASNIGSVSVKISDKLKSLADKGLIKHEKQELLSAMYWYEVPIMNVSEVQ